MCGRLSLAVLALVVWSGIAVTLGRGNEKGSLDPVRLMRAEMCAQLLQKMGAMFDSEIGGCDAFMKEVCNPGKEKRMSVVRTESLLQAIFTPLRERATGQGYCKLYFPEEVMDETATATAATDATIGQEVHHFLTSFKDVFGAQEAATEADKRAAARPIGKRRATPERETAEKASAEQAAERAPARQAAAQREAGEKAAAVEKAAAEQAAAKELSVQEAAAKNAATNEAAAKEAAAKEAVAKKSVADAKEATAKETAAKEAAVREAAAKSAAVKAAVAIDASVRKATPKQAAVTDAAAKDVAEQAETAAKEGAAKEAVAKEAARRETAAKEAAAKEAAAKEAAVRQAKQGSAHNDMLTSTGDRHEETLCAQHPRQVSCVKQNYGAGGAQGSSSLHFQASKHRPLRSRTSEHAQYSGNQRLGIQFAVGLVVIASAAEAAAN